MQHVIDLRPKQSNALEYAKGFFVVALIISSLLGWEMALSQPTCTAIDQHNVVCK